MNQQASGQIWQHLQAHIENYFSPTPADDVQKIEYKPPFIALLEMPSEHHPNNQLETSRGSNTGKIKT